MKCPLCGQEMKDQGFTGSSYFEFVTVRVWTCGCGTSVEESSRPKSAS